MKKLLLLLFSAVSIGLSAQTTIEVQNINDAGTGSLRQAVMDASSGDTIRFNPALLSGGSALITLTSEIAFSKSLTIKGIIKSSSAIILSGDYTNRIFNINTTGNIYFDSLLLAWGDAGSGNGGAVLCASDSLFINNSVISQCNANSGGGISSSSSAILINNSVIYENTAITDGGGIHFLSATPSSSSITLNNSTINDNSVNYYGGGIYVSTSLSSNIIVNNSTIAENTADSGGGISSGASDNSIIDINNSTITGNSANARGAGVYSAAVSLSQISTKGSIIADNTGPDPIFNSFTPTIFSTGYNLFSDSPNGAISLDSTNVSTASLDLQILDNNGGFSPTKLPGALSVAIDAGDPADMTDAQNRPLVGIRDIGAAEYNCVENVIKNITACSSHTWIDGNSYMTDTSGVAHTYLSSVSGICDTIFTLELTINELPDVTTTANNETIAANLAGATYQWLDCDDNNEPIAGATSLSYTATVNGNYAVIVDNGNCTDTSACVSINSIGISDNEKDSMIQLYPNPTNGNITLVLPSLEPAIIEVYNALGALVSTQRSNAQQVNLNVQGENGIYFIKVNSTHYTKTIHLVKNK